MKSLSLTKPHMIIMVGIPGSGKSFFARQFGDTFHAPVVSYDAISNLAKSGVAASELMYQQLTELAKTRQSIIVDGLADSRAERGDLLKCASSAGYEPLYVWVQTDLATARLRASKSKDETKSALSSDEHAKLVKKFSEPAANEKTIVISGKHTYATQARVVLKKLSAPRAAAAVTPEVPPARVEPTSTPRGAHTIVVR